MGQNQKSRAKLLIDLATGTSIIVLVLTIGFLIGDPRDRFGPANVWFKRWEEVKIPDTKKPFGMVFSPKNKGGAVIVVRVLGDIEGSAILKIHGVNISLPEQIESRQDIDWYGGDVHAYYEPLEVIDGNLKVQSLLSKIKSS